MSEGLEYARAARVRVRDELRSLIGRGLIRKTSRGFVHELADHFDLVEHFKLTEA
jgi:hypothetical protein